MTAFKASASRLPSRAGSTARDIVKRRDKTYRTEQKRVLERRKKLDLQTSYANAPQGYVFVPVGTPDLSNRCKDLSRQRAYPVHVVNAKPVSKHAWDAQKVSHHIHRIGYHFRGEIVEQACKELGYVPNDGKYAKPEDVLKRYKESHLSKTLLKYGISMTMTTQTRETLDQVRVAIKELFPKIPEEDLRQIIKHAWAEGSDRVGTNETLDLPRRVQLAVIARIRHKYTDYDLLLRAFEWAEARRMVEPGCLEKIIEWRGENDDMDDDQELEEIVRETIVIDDDEDELVGDEDVVDLSNMSDTSIEITHEIALDGDLGAESTDERSRAFHNRFLPARRTLAERSGIARQKIDAAKKRLREGLPSRTVTQTHYLEPAPQFEHRAPIPQHRQGFVGDLGHPQYQVPYNVAQIPVHPLPAKPQHQQEHHKYQEEEQFMHDRQHHSKAPPLPAQPWPEYRHLHTSQGATPWEQQVQREPLPRSSLRRMTSSTAMAGDPQSHDWPVASIEHDHAGRNSAAVGYQRTSPAQRLGPPPGAEIIDLTSPPRPQLCAPDPQPQFSVYNHPQTHVQRVVYQAEVPVHSAPTPVQYRVPGAWPESPGRPLPPPPPADGAAAPTQYYYPR